MINYDYRELTGEVITREDFEYEEERKGWNRAIEKYPLVIVYCEYEEDIRNAIIFAKTNSLSVRIRSGRHHYEGYSTGNDIVVIDVSKMNKIYIDEENSKIKIQGGVKNRELYEVTGKRGYPFPGGGCPTVGVVGFTLGGGWGYSSRLLGLGCDRLVEVELINCNGELVICNKEENEDLFWALRGCGGGNFGIVTSMTFNLPSKVENVTLVNIDFTNIDIEENIDLIEKWQELYKTLDKRANFKLVSYNCLERGRGAKIVGLIYGDKKLANDILRPIKDIVSEGIYKLEYISILEANRIIQDSHPEFEKYKSAGRFVYKDYNREEIAELLEIIEERAEGTKYAAITLYGLGGVIKEVKNDNTAFYHRNANFILGFQSVWEDARFTLVNRRWLVEKLKYIKTITEGAFINFPCFEINDKSQTYEQEYYGGNTNVLKLIKEKYDKDDFFNFEQDIRIERKLFYDFLVE